jgi:hypothetical protein
LAFVLRVAYFTIAFLTAFLGGVCGLIFACLKVMEMDLTKGYDGQTNACASRMSIFKITLKKFKYQSTN